MITSNDILTCMLTKNDCYKIADKITPIGVMVHSTGANNNKLRRYVQPSSDDPNFRYILDVLGTNTNRNSWNRSRKEGAADTCVHFFLGEDWDGFVNIVQTLPLNYRGWHAGRGKKGSANDSYLSFEVCEDEGATKYTQEVIMKAEELVAWLCTIYNWNPLDPRRVISHAEGYKLGIASNHGDIDSYLKTVGLTMNDFRMGVKNVMTEGTGLSEWAKDAMDWANRLGITDGTRPQANCIREEVITMLYRYNNFLKGEMNNG